MTNNQLKKQQGNALFSIIFVLVLAAVAYLFFSGGSNNEVKDASSLANDDNGLYILAGSELKDLEPFIPQIKQATGVQIGFEYTGTLDGVDAISTGKQVDAAWFSHGKYLTLIDPNRIKAQEQIMLSPVVMGVKKSKAQQFGWINADGSPNPITWQNIADKSANGELKFAMTNPASSNSGFTALMGVVAALAGTSDAPQQADIDKAKPKLKAFFKGQALNSGSSGWLAEQFVKEQTKLDAMINYESVLMQLNKSNQLQEPLVLLYPKEGIVTADYPIMLMNANKKEAFTKLTDYLKSAEFQQLVMSQTDRRPVNRHVKLDPKFNSGANKLLVELPFPNNNNVVDSILMSYQDEIRIPAHVYFVLDMSGSMTGDGITQLKGAMLSLTNAQSGSSRFAKFSKQEVITIIPFDDAPQAPMVFDLSKNYEGMISGLQTEIHKLAIGGSTAIYDSLELAYRAVEQDKTSDLAKGVQRYYSIVLMTDGANSSGQSFSKFENNYPSYPELVRGTKTFTVLFGDADETEMRQVAQMTGGRMFDGRKANLARVFKKIRGYQ